MRNDHDRLAITTNNNNNKQGGGGRKRNRHAGKQALSTPDENILLSLSSPPPQKKKKPSGQENKTFQEARAEPTIKYRTNNDYQHPSPNPPNHDDLHQSVRQGWTNAHESIYLLTKKRYRGNPNKRPVTGYKKKLAI